MTARFVQDAPARGGNRAIIPFGNGAPQRSGVGRDFVEKRTRTSPGARKPKPRSVRTVDTQVSPPTDLIHSTLLGGCFSASQGESGSRTLVHALSTRA